MDPRGNQPNFEMRVFNSLYDFFTCLRSSPGICIETEGRNRHLSQTNCTETSSKVRHAHERSQYPPLSHVCVCVCVELSVEPFWMFQTNSHVIHCFSRIQDDLQIRL